jgi:hypothetical protein
MRLRRLLRPLLIVGLLLVVRPLAAQNPPPVLDTVRARLALDTVVGVVYDSLAEEPLAGAFVIAYPSGASAVSDSLGRFVIYTDTIATRVSAYHGVLDQLGLGALVATRPDNRRTPLRLSTPAFPTIWRSLCDQPRPLGGRSVIVTGTARLADGTTRVAGANVIVQWPKPEYAVGGGDVRSREVRTDSLGNFLVCGVEDFVEVSLAAVSREYRSGIITVPSDVRSLRRVDLMLASENATGRLTGVVKDRQGTPLADIQLALDGAAEPVITDVTGRFTFPDAPLGSRMLYVRAIGYQPIGQLVEVRADANEPLEIPFDRIVQIEGVTVTEKANVRLDRAEFELRKRAGFGRVIDSTALARFPNLRAAMQQTPGIIVTQRQGRASTEFDIFGRVGCRAFVYLDGTVTNLDEVNAIPLENLAAVEVFTNVAFAPARYQPLGDNCAVILFWTRFGLRP